MKVSSNKPIEWPIPTVDGLSRLDAALGPKGNCVMHFYKCHAVVPIGNLVREVEKKKGLLMQQMELGESACIRSGVAMVGRLRLMQGHVSVQCYTESMPGGK